MILAYLRAAEFLCAGLIAGNYPTYHMNVFRNNQICMPFLYVCRHALELAMKFRLRVEINKSVSGHKLSELYSSLIKCSKELKNKIQISRLTDKVMEQNDTIDRLQEKVSDLGHLERHLGREQMQSKWNGQRHWNRQKGQRNT